MAASAGYAWLLRDRRALGFLTASIGARLAFAMLPLGLLLFVQQTTGSIAAAGFAAGSWGVATALHPVRGRLVDRHGPGALAGFVAAFAAALAALVLVGSATSAAAPVVAAAALAGLVVPPVGPFARAVWSATYRQQPTRLRTAFAADSVLDEATLVAGPVLVGAAVALASPGAAIAVAAVVMLVAGLATAGAPLARGLGAVEDTEPDADGGASSRRPLQLTLLVLAGLAGALGAVEVTVPAFATARDAPAAAGLLAAALSAGSVAGGLLYGVRGGRGEARRRLPVWAGLCALALIPSLLATSVPALGLLLVLPGLALGPLWIVLYTVVDAATPAGQGTRVFGWVVTANNSGVAAGAALGGALIAAHGTRAGLLLAVALAAAGAAVAVPAGRATAVQEGSHIGSQP